MMMIDLKELKIKNSAGFYIHQDEYGEAIDRAIAAESKLAEIEAQEPYTWTWQHANGKLASDLFNTEQDVIDAWGSFSASGKQFALYALPVQPSPATQHWSKDRPTKPGNYWFRTDESNGVLMKISLYKDLQSGIAEHLSAEPMIPPHNIAKAGHSVDSMDGEWLRPSPAVAVPEPKEMLRLFEIQFPPVPQVSGIDFYPDRNEFLTKNELWKKFAKGRTDAFHGFVAAFNLLSTPTPPSAEQNCVRGWSISEGGADITSLIHKSGAKISILDRKPEGIWFFDEEKSNLNRFLAAIDYAHKDLFYAGNASGAEQLNSSPSAEPNPLGLGTPVYVPEFQCFTADKQADPITVVEWKNDKLQFSVRDETTASALEMLNKKLHELAEENARLKSEQPDSAAPKLNQIVIDAGVLGMIEVTLLNAFVHLRDTGSDRKSLMNSLNHWYEFLKVTLNEWDEAEPSINNKPQRITEQPDSAAVEPLMYMIEYDAGDGGGKQYLRAFPGANPNDSHFSAPFPVYRHTPNKPQRITEQPDSAAVKPDRAVGEETVTAKSRALLLVVDQFNKTNVDYLADRPIGELHSTIKSLKATNSALKYQLREQIEKSTPVSNLTSIYVLQNLLTEALTAADLIRTGHRNKDLSERIRKKVGLVTESLNQMGSAPQRITEQDAREIAKSWQGEGDLDAYFSYWLSARGGRDLLAKLNEHRDRDYKSQRDELLEATKAVTNLAMLHVGYNNKIVDCALQAIAKASASTDRGGE